MRAPGGFLGGCCAYGSALEHQGAGTPHQHGQVHICCAYQYKLLTEIAELIEADILDPQSIIEFQEWVHMTEPPNQELHESMMPHVEG